MKLERKAKDCVSGGRGLERRKFKKAGAGSFIGTAPTAFVESYLHDIVVKFDKLPRLASYEASLCVVVVKGVKKKIAQEVSCPTFGNRSPHWRLDVTKEDYCCCRTLFTNLKVL